MKWNTKWSALTAAIVLASSLSAAPYEVFAATAVSGTTANDADKQATATDGDGGASTAVGEGATAKNGGTAVGAGSSASDKDTIAVGNGASSAEGIAIGKGATASIVDTGTNAHSTIAIGCEATAAGGIAIGHGASANTGLALGAYAQSSGYGIAIGLRASATDYGIAIGGDAQALGMSSIAIEGRVDEKVKYGIAIGSQSAVHANFGVALGQDADVRGSSSTALGFDANTTEEANNSVAIGQGSRADEAYTVAVGCPVYYSKDGLFRNAITRRITYVADGINNTDAATYGQLVSANAIKDTSGAITGYTPYSADSNGIVTVLTNKGETAFQIKVGSSGGSAGSYTGDNKTIGVSATNVISVKYDTADFTVNDNGLAVKKDGKVEAGNTGLVTGGTVYDALQAMDNQAARLTDDINKVGAGAAALAALRPEGFDPNDKWSFAVGYGHYKNANAGALGAFFKPNADTTVSLSSTIGNGDPMMNAGLSFKLGQRGKNAGAYRNAVELVRRVDALEATDARHEALIAAQQKEIAAQAQEIRELREQVAALMKHAGLTASVQKAVTR